MIPLPAVHSLSSLEQEQNQRRYQIKKNATAAPISQRAVLRSRPFRILEPFTDGGPSTISVNEVLSLVCRRVAAAGALLMLKA